MMNKLKGSAKDDSKAKLKSRTGDSSDGSPSSSSEYKGIPRRASLLGFTDSSSPRASPPQSPHISADSPGALRAQLDGAPENNRSGILRRLNQSFNTSNAPRPPPSQQSPTEAGAHRVRAAHDGSPVSPASPDGGNKPSLLKRLSLSFNAPPPELGSPLQPQTGGDPALRNRTGSLVVDAPMLGPPARSPEGNDKGKPSILKRLSLSFNAPPPDMGSPLQPQTGGDSSLRRTGSMVAEGSPGSGSPMSASPDGSNRPSLLKRLSLSFSSPPGELGSPLQAGDAQARARAGSPAVSGNSTPTQSGPGYRVGARRDRNIALQSPTSMEGGVFSARSEGSRRGSQHELNSPSRSPHGGNRFSFRRDKNGPRLSLGSSDASLDPSSFKNDGQLRRSSQPVVSSPGGSKGTLRRGSSFVSSPRLSPPESPSYSARNIAEMDGRPPLPSASSPRGRPPLASQSSSGQSPKASGTVPRFSGDVRSRNLQVQLLGAVYIGGGVSSATFYKDRTLLPPTHTSTVQDWLSTLASRDAQRRFTASSLAELSAYVNSRVSETRSTWHHTFSDPQMWALLTYSTPLSEDAKGEQLSPIQLNDVFDALCYAYTHCKSPPSTLQAQWELFLPFTINFDSALRLLPVKPAILLREMLIEEDISMYPPGTKCGMGNGSRATFEAMNIGSFFLIVTDQARSLPTYGSNAMEDACFHPMSQEYEVLGHVLAPILRLLSYPGNIIPIKPVGTRLPLDAYYEAMKNSTFIFQDLLKTFVPPLVTDDIFATNSFPLHDRITEFLASNSQVLVLAGKPGMGKTSCALWLASQVPFPDHWWIYIPLHEVANPFTAGAITDHVQAALGIPAGDPALNDLKKRPVVLVLDGLEELQLPDSGALETWWDLNAFEFWCVKLVITCRQDAVKNFHRLIGMAPAALVLYVQGFGKQEMRDYLRLQCGPSHLADSPASQKTAYQRYMSRLPQASNLQNYCSPMKYTMVTALPAEYIARPFQHDADLYEAWFSHWFNCHPLQKSSANVWEEAEQLAWEFFSQNLVVDTMGTRCNQETFRSLPLCCTTYSPTSVFTFVHRTLQDFLTARYIYRCIENGNNSVLTLRDLTKDIPLLSFFGGIFQGRKAKGRDVSRIQKQLLDSVLASRGYPAQAVLMSASNSITLLCAAGVSFQGSDLSRINVPGANLQCADFYRCNLSFAKLTNTDLMGAILDCADLQGADLEAASVDSLMHTYEGKSPVNSVAISTSGKAVWFAMEKTLYVWRANNAQPLRSLSGHSDEITCIALSGNGAILVSASKDRTVRLWETRTGQPMQVLKGYNGVVTNIAASGNANVLVCCSGDGMAHVWNAKIDQIGCALPWTSGPMTTVAISSDAKVIAAGTNGRQVCIYNSTGTLLKTLKMHTQAVSTVAVSDDGTLVVSGSLDSNICLWRMPEGQLLYTLKGHTSAINSVAISNDNSTIASASEDKVIRIWRVGTGEMSCLFEGHTQGVSCVALTCDGSQAVSGAKDNSVCVWRVSQDVSLHTKPGHSRIILGVAISADGSCAASASQDRTVRLWDCSTGQTKIVLYGHLSTVQCVSLSADGNLVVTGSHDCTTRVWNATTGESLHNFRKHRKPINAVAMTSNGDMFASGSEDMIIYIVRWNSGEVIQTIENHDDVVTSLAFSGNGSILVSGSWDDTVRLWNTSGRMQKSIKANGTTVSTVAISNNGSLLAAGCEDQTVKLWKMSGGGADLLFTLTGHTDRVTSVCMSGSGTVIASGSRDMTVRLWCGLTGTLKTTLEGHTWMVSAIAISSDGQKVISSSFDKSLRLWNQTTGTCQVWRNIGQGTLDLFAHKCRLSAQTTLSPGLRRKLLELGAQMS